MLKTTLSIASLAFVGFLGYHAFGPHDLSAIGLMTWLRAVGISLGIGSLVGLAEIASDAWRARSETVRGAPASTTEVERIDGVGDWLDRLTTRLVLSEQEGKWKELRPGETIEFASQIAWWFTLLTLGTFVAHHAFGTHDLFTLGPVDWFRIVAIAGGGSLFIGALGALNSVYQNWKRRPRS